MVIPAGGEDDVVEVGAFSEIQSEFQRRVERIVWCSVATMDRQGRPRSRILHPVWEYPDGRPMGSIATGRHTLKTKHLARNPYVSLSYWDPQHEQVSIDCRAWWEDGEQEKARIWELFRTAPEPVGYDPAMIWSGLNDPNFGVLRLEPWRVEVWCLTEMAQGTRPRVWRPDS